MNLGSNQQAFLALLRAGLWERDIRLLQYGDIDYSIIYQLSVEQSVVGLVAAGLGHVIDIKPPKEIALKFVGETLQLEKMNNSMNCFIGVLVDKMREEDIYALLVKGQGVAQCYERPLWRSIGDVDLLLDSLNYDKAKSLLLPLSTSVEEEYTNYLHLGLVIEPWKVELHGTLRSGLTNRIDRIIDQLQAVSTQKGNNRKWENGGTEILLPAHDEDVLYVFTHILQHFYREGSIGFKQICDWCRLLWTYKDKFDLKLLELRLNKMGIMNEWLVFGLMAVNYFGMPPVTMPFYVSNNRNNKKARSILESLLDEKSDSYPKLERRQTRPYLINKIISFWNNTRRGFKHFRVFPLTAFKVWFRMLFVGLTVVAKGDEHE